MNTVYDIYKNIIVNGDFVLSSIEEKIETVYAQDRITAQEREDLISLANETVKARNQTNIEAKLAELEAKIKAIENGGNAVPVWKDGMSVHNGQTVLYDVLSDGAMRYCRYDGGRTATSLPPGDISGWVVLASTSGVVTHRVVKIDNKTVLERV